MKILIKSNKKPAVKKLAAFEEQLQELKQHLKAGRRWHHDRRPWFVVLGDKEARTEWMQGLHLIATWQKAGVITATKEAVFFAPTGETSVEFFKLLHKNRSIKAPQGVIVCLPVTEITSEEKQLEGLKQASLSYFGQVPVYLVLTGLQKVEGFLAYAKKILAEQKNQVFGVAAPLSFDAFKNLHQHLDQKVMGQLDYSLAAAQNSEVVFFPHHLAETYAKILAWANAVGHVTPHLNRLMVRGVYFSGLIDSTDYFSGAILRDVFLKDVKAFSTIKQLDLWLYQQRKPIFGGVAMGMALLFTIWYLGLQHDEAYLDQVNFLLDQANMNSQAAEFSSFQQLHDLGEESDSWMIRFLGVFFPNQVKNAIDNEYEYLLSLQSPAPVSAPDNSVPVFHSIMEAINFVQSAISNNSFGANENDTLNAVVTILRQYNSANGSIDLSSSLLSQSLAPFNAMQANSSLNPLLRQIVAVVFRTASVALAGRVDAMPRSCTNALQYANHLATSPLANFVILSNGTVQNREAYGVPFILPTSAKINLTKALLIRSAFFSMGSEAAFTVNFTPLFLSKNLAEFRVSDGSQTLFYQNGPRISQTFSWPNGSGTVVVTFTDLNGRTVSKTYTGSGGLINFLNSATVTAVDPTHYNLTFTLGNYNASYEVNLMSGNFAGILALGGMHC